MKKYRIGYTQGVYDMFHIGHLNLLNNAKRYCDILIVGVNADSLVQSYKYKTPVINENERRYIVENIKAVDECIIDNEKAFTFYKRSLKQKVHIKTFVKLVLCSLREQR